MLISSKLLQLERSDYLSSIIPSVCQGEVGAKPAVFSGRYRGSK